jgi:hypothetical protein
MGVCVLNVGSLPAFVFAALPLVETVSGCILLSVEWLDNDNYAYQHITKLGISA